ncbi:MAG: class I SAM-dependent methyltransferase [Cyclobacteriaceae bacterium]|jgi:ubiquinone/menaquinone biosynthesis C-methylase UbiE|nr:class I SAM-dependent methyltransferase [Cyclobacteriaceae bacterium]
MAVPFDHIAPTHSTLFKHTVISQLQRKRVWRYLEQITPELNGLEILELTCGTGDDAALFGERGVSLIATDLSEEMLKVTQQRVKQYSLQNKISSCYIDVDTFDETVFNKKFDLIFSNFNGINCVSPTALQKLLQKIPSIMAPGGRLVAVVMPKRCLWETFHFALKLNFAKAFRRWTDKPVLAEAEQGVRTWFYQPSRIVRWAGESFRKVRTMPVGITIPPGFLEKFFSRRKRTLFKLYSLEKKLSRFAFLASFSDHYIIDLQLK